MGFRPKTKDRKNGICDLVRLFKSQKTEQEIRIWGLVWDLGIGRGFRMIVRGSRSNRGFPWGHGIFPGGLRDLGFSLGDCGILYQHKKQEKWEL